MLTRVATFTFFLLVCAFKAQASPLCDPSCTINISFPGGGRLQAIDGDVILSFDDGGLVDTGEAATAYMQGNSLILNAGDSLEFGPGGTLQTGELANIEYIHLKIETDGDFSINSASESAVFSVAQNQTLELSGGVSLIVHSGTLNLSGRLIFNDEGSLTLGGGSEDSGTSTEEASSGATLSWLSPSSESLSISTAGTIDVDSFGEIDSGPSLELSIGEGAFQIQPGENTILTTTSGTLQISQASIDAPEEDGASDEVENIASQSDTVESAEDDVASSGSIDHYLAVFLLILLVARADLRRLV